MLTTFLLDFYSVWERFFVNFASKLEGRGTKKHWKTNSFLRFLLLRPSCQQEATWSIFWSTWHSTWDPKPIKSGAKRPSKSQKKLSKMWCKLAWHLEPSWNGFWWILWPSWEASWNQVGLSWLSYPVLSDLILPNLGWGRLVLSYLGYLGYLGLYPGVECGDLGPTGLFREYHPRGPRSSPRGPKTPSKTDFWSHFGWFFFIF